MPKGSAWLLVSLAGALAGCVRSGVAPVAPLEGPAVASDYLPVGPAPEATTRLVKDGDVWQTWDVSLPPRVPAAFAASASPLPDAAKPIHMTWFRPNPSREPRTRRPAVVISPILGSDTQFVADFAAAFARRGWHGLVVRRPKVDYDPTLPVEQVEERSALVVSRQVQALDWLLATGEADPARIGSFGISAGGITNAMVAGVDRRYTAHVIALAGGPLCDVLVDSDEGSLRRLVAKGAKAGATKDDMREQLRRAVRTDPVLLAPGVDPKMVLLFLARYDTTVPTRTGLALREALGDPATVWIPFGHRTSILALPFIFRDTLAFLASRFGED